MAVLGLAAWQLMGVDRLFRHAGADGTHRICLDVPVDASPERTFDAIRDLGRIADHTPALHHSSLRDGAAPGVGAVRQCEDHRGRRWAERCTRLDHARLELDFLTHEPGFPYPFETMSGGWKVEPREGGATVRVWWVVTPKHRWLAPVFLPVMVAGLRHDVPPVIASLAGDSSPSRRGEPRAAVC